DPLSHWGSSEIGSRRGVHGPEPYPNARWKCNRGVSAPSGAPLQLAMKPRARECPVALHGRGGDAERLARLLDGEPREEAKLDYARLPLVELGEAIERLVQLLGGDIERQRARERFTRRVRVLERHAHRAAAALLRVAPACVVHEDATHGLRGEPHEVRAVLPGDLALVEQPDVGLVRERRRLERVARAFAPKVAAGETAHLVVHEREERVQRALVALTPAKERSGDIGGGRSPLGGFHDRREYSSSVPPSGARVSPPICGSTSSVSPPGAP